MSFPRYPKYKPSGVEWLGDVPEHWHVRRLSSLSSKITNGYVGPTRDIFVDDGVRYLQSLHIKGNRVRFDVPYFVSEEWSNRHGKSILEAGDVLIVQTGDIGQVAVVTDEFAGCNCHALIVVAPVREVVGGVWISWLLNSDYGFHTLLSIQTGALHPHLNCGDVKDIPIPLPPTDEQIKIAAFLDRETAKIDALVAEQRRLIELLKEKRQAVISHAVTKGLNPDAPMKPSGIEWLGDVPEHWEVGRVKNYFLTCSGGTPNTSQQELYYADEYSGIPWVRTTDLQNGILRSVEVFITEKALSDTACTILPPGTIMVAMYGGDGTVGKNGLLAISAAINQAVCGLLPSTTHNSEYAFRFMQFYRPYWMIGAESSRKDPNISQERVRNAPFPRPPIDEQNAIVEFLSAKLQGFDSLTAEAERAIELLQERRTALISAAVTGKIDVRDCIPPTSLHAG